MKTIVTALLTLLLAASAHAGAWGAGSFDNDDALDWTNECVTGHGAQPLALVFERVSRSKIVEASDGAAAIAAAEVVAAALGKRGQGFPAELGRWLEKQPAPELIAQAAASRQALAKVEDARTSELRQLWGEGKSTQWLAKVKDLESRLGRH
jgi:hypothetical protein